MKSTVSSNSLPFAVFMITTTLTLFFSDHALAAADTDFSVLFNFINEAATGFLGRSIAIVGGMTGLVYGAVTGRLALGASGIVLGALGAIGPQVIDAVFATATL